MSYEVKFGWVANNELGYTAYAPSGTGRGLHNQHLPEVRPTGYYRDTPATDLVVGDVVLVYQRENVEYESELVYILNFEDVYYDNVQVQHEQEYVKDYGTTAEQRVIWLDNPVGSGEYDDLTGTTDSIDDLTTGQTTVFNTYDERDGGGAGAGDGVESLVTHDC